MGIVVMIRNNKQMSYFRECLLGLMALDVADEIYLSSGFFQEYLEFPGHNYHTYYVTAEKNIHDQSLTTVLQNKVNFKSIILVGCKEDNKTKSGITVPLPNVKSVQKAQNWTESFRNFYVQMRNAYPNKQVTAYYAKKLNWHAKISVFCEKGIPVAGIIGSTNFTRPAFGATQFYNVEADVLLFDDKLGSQITTILNDIDQYINRNKLDTAGLLVLSSQNLKFYGGTTGMDWLKKEYEYIVDQITSGELVKA